MPGRWVALTILAGLVGLTLVADSATHSGATYDETAYLQVAARWWRTGDQTAITRMGSPLTFWKWQQVPTLWWLDHQGKGAWIDAPLAHQADLLNAVRLGALPIWLAAFTITALWARGLHGPRAMAFAAWLFALSPNLVAHGALVTMEMPLVAGAVAVFAMAWRFLETGRWPWGLVTAATTGLAFSCKFTAILFPPILTLVWVAELWRHGRLTWRMVRLMGLGMLGFLATMALANATVTGFATISMSERIGDHPTLNRFPEFVARAARTLLEHPLPQDWVGFAKQMGHQRHGGPSYLFGQRRMTGWWYYYAIALAVKVPLSVGFLVGARFAQGRAAWGRSGDRLILLTIAAFLAITSAGSTRNYGLRYLLPLAPLAIVWVSGLAEAGRWARRAAILGLAAQAVSLASIHPHELSYINILAGGPTGGRRILADSCLDWGQGTRSLARLQTRHPEYRDLTLYQFGDPASDPKQFGVEGRIHVIDASDIHPGLPPRFSAQTRYVAVSASLQWGPWGPPGYFHSLKGVAPLTLTDDFSIAIYRSLDIWTRGPQP